MDLLSEAAITQHNNLGRRAQCNLRALYIAQFLCSGPPGARILSVNALSWQEGRGTGRKEGDLQHSS